MEAVARAVGAPARQQEAREPALGLRQHEERVAHRRRAEPLVAGELVLGAGAAAAERARARRVGAHVGAALLLGHRHAARARRSSPPPGACAGRSGRREARLPLRRELGLRAQRRHARVGHRDRTAVARLDLRQHEEERGARHVRARAAARATAARAARGATASAHELVPRGVELDLVDAVAEAVVRAQHRRIRVGLSRPSRAASPPALGAERGAPLPRPAGALALERLAEHAVRARRGCSPRAAAAGSAPRGSAAWWKSSRPPVRARRPAAAESTTGSRGAPGARPMAVAGRRVQSGCTRATAGGQASTQALNAWRQAWKPGSRTSRASSRHSNATAWAWSMHPSSPLQSAMAACLSALHGGERGVERALDRPPCSPRDRRGTPRRSRGRGCGRHPSRSGSPRGTSAPHGLGRPSPASCTCFGSIDSDRSPGGHAPRQALEARSATGVQLAALLSCAPDRDTRRRRAARCRCTGHARQCPGVEVLAVGDRRLLVALHASMRRHRSRWRRRQSARSSRHASTQTWSLFDAGVLRSLEVLLTVALALPVLARDALMHWPTWPGPGVGGARSRRRAPARVPVEVRVRLMTTSPVV